MVKISANRIDLETKRLERAQFKNTTQAIVLVTASATTTLDVSLGNVFKISQAVDITTLNITNIPATGQMCSITIIRIKDATGTARAITWPASFNWAAASAIVPTQTLSAVDMFSIFTMDAGTTWYESFRSLKIATFSATGGTITNSGGYTIHTFTTSGTFTPSSSVTVDYLVVAGGGGGGNGGGGAGGLLQGSTSLTGQAYTITVGAGGSGVNGNNSVFSSFTAVGGGIANAAGGSGGGGQGQINTTGGAGTGGQGNNGGNGNASSSYAPGGGGGAGAVGATFSGGQSGAGGVGLSVSISGSAVYYAGGGGGGGSNEGAVAGAGGNGGGGAGGAGGGGTGVSGTANTGGGGGGAGRQAGAAYGTGGSGIVIIRYLT